MSILKLNKSSIPILLPGALLMAAIIFLSFLANTQGANLWIDLLFFILINIGLIVALIIGVKTNKKSIVLFSVLVNSTLFLIGSYIIVMYLFVMIVR